MMIKPYLNMIVFRGYAHDLPYNPWMIALWLILDFFLVILVVATFGDRIFTNIGLEIFDVLFSAAIITLLLRFYNRPTRFVQTFSALLGANVILFGALVLIAIVSRNPELFGMLAQPVYLWFLAVFASILKDALEVSWFKAILWMLATELTRLTVLMALY